MSKKKDNETNPCLKCGKPQNLLPGATCNSCIRLENERAKQHAAQRLAGQIPPKGSSV